MTSFQWLKRRGYEFTPEEAREASDFVEVLRNFGFDDPERAYHLFKERGDLGVAKRLVFAETIDIDRATVLLLCDPDERIRGVVEQRLREYRNEQTGGIIVATH